MEASPDSGSKQAPSRNDASFSSSSSEEEEKPKVTGPVAATPHMGQAGTPHMGQGQGGRMTEKDELFRLQFVMPEYLRVAMATAVESKLSDSPGFNAPPLHTPPPAPKCPLIVMINSKSGGRQGPALRSVLNNLLTKEQVFDLSVCPPKDFFRFGLGCLERLAERGDQCAKDTRNQLRVIVAGGDGTVGWVLGSMTELHVEGRMPVPPVGIIPLGTGNDLSRSFGWGDTYGSSSDVNAASFEGIFYNYFSIGMDAQVAYGFHHLRERQPHLARGQISNKLVYSSCGCAQGWFCTPCSANPRVRGLYNIMQLYVRREPNGDWERVELPHNVRAVIMLNLQSYASGRNPWGHPTDEYNQRKNFVQPSSNDGLFEIFGLFDGWHTSLVMLSMRSAKRLAQACAIRMELVADQRHRVYMQMDGEPWRQPLSENENSTVIEITHVPTHSLMLKAT